MKRTVWVVLLGLGVFAATRLSSPGDAASADSGGAEVVQAAGAPGEVTFLTRPPADVVAGAMPSADDSSPPAVVAGSAQDDEEQAPEPLDPGSPGADLAFEIEVAAALLHGGTAGLERLEADGSLGAAPASGRGASLAVARAFLGALEGAPEAAAALTRGRTNAAQGVALAAPLDFLSRFLGETLPRGKEAFTGSDGPLTLAMGMAAAAREGLGRLEAGQYEEAVMVFSKLLLQEVSAPWPSSPGTLAGWTASLMHAQEEHRWNRRGSWPSVDVTVRDGDSLTAIRRRFVEEQPDQRLCTGQIARANEVVGYIQPGQVLRLPTDGVSMLVDLESRWLFYLIGEDEVGGAWPVGIGKPGEATLEGDFVVGEKIENPMWFRRGKEPVPFGHPENALGTRWIAWFQNGRKTGYGFHGTNDPDSIGRAESEGCIRMRNQDVESLMEVLPMGAVVRVQH